jgi:hypothetical protein
MLEKKQSEPVTTTILPEANVAVVTVVVKAMRALGDTDPGAPIPIKWQAFLLQVSVPVVATVSLGPCAATAFATLSRAVPVVAPFPIR